MLKRKEIRQTKQWQEAYAACRQAVQESKLAQWFHHLCVGGGIVMIFWAVLLWYFFGSDGNGALDMFWVGFVAFMIPTCMSMCGLAYSTPSFILALEVDAAFWQIVWKRIEEAGIGDEAICENDVRRTVEVLTDEDVARMAAECLNLLRKLHRI